MKFFKNKQATSVPERRRWQAGGVPVRRSAAPSINLSNTFVRGRTLTSVAQEEVTGAHSGRSQLHALHRQRRLMRQYAIMCAIVIALVGFLLSNRLTGADITVDNSNVSFGKADKTLLYSSFNNYIDQHPTQLFLISLQNDQFLDYMRTTHPEIKSVRFDNQMLGLQHQLRLTFRQPLLEWKVGKKNYFVDSEGIAFEKNYFAAPKVTVEDQSGVTVSDSSSIPRRLIGYIGQLTGAIQTNNIGTVARLVIPASSREVDVYVEGRGYPVKTHIDRDAYDTAGDIQSSFRYLDAKGIQPKYVDVRIAGKAYYL